jgi:hypothetical protein
MIILHSIEHELLKYQFSILRLLSPQKKFTMEKFSFEDYLEKRYQDQLKYYSLAANKNQNKYNKFQWSIFILSTITTILAALPDALMLFNSIQIEFKYLIVITSGLVTVLTAGLKTFKYEELYLNYRKTAEKLKPHFFLYQMNIGKYGEAGANKETVFVETVEEILNKQQMEWLTIKNPTDPAGQQKLEEMQAKIDDLLREKFKTVKPKAKQPVVPAPEEVADYPEAPVTEAPETTETGEEDLIETTENQTDTGEETMDAPEDIQPEMEDETTSESDESTENEEAEGDETQVKKP